MQKNDHVEMALLYVPFPNLTEASKAAKALLTDKLIVCANIIPGVLSIYNQLEEIKELPEAIVIFKTSKKKIVSLKSAIETLHSYDVPIIIEIGVESINEKAAKWLSV